MYQLTAEVVTKKKVCIYMLKAWCINYIAIASDDHDINSREVNNVVQVVFQTNKQTSQVREGTQETFSNHIHIGQ